MIVRPRAKRRQLHSRHRTVKIARRVPFDVYWRSGPNLGDHLGPTQLARDEQAYSRIADQVIE
jgi:hypothetical protein